MSVWAQSCHLLQVGEALRRRAPCFKQHALVRVRYDDEKSTTFWRCGVIVASWKAKSNFFVPGAEEACRTATCSQLMWPAGMPSFAAIAFARSISKPVGLITFDAAQRCRPGSRRRAGRGRRSGRRSASSAAALSRSTCRRRTPPTRSSCCGGRAAAATGDGEQESERQGGGHCSFHWRAPLEGVGRNPRNLPREGVGHESLEVRRSAVRCARGGGRLERARADAALHALDEHLVLAADLAVELEQLLDPRLVLAGARRSSRGTAQSGSARPG